MHYRVLGPLEVQGWGRTLDLGRPKQRAVLAVLLVEANTVVSLDRLIDLLWGDEPPARSTASLQVYVSNLRRVLEPDRPPKCPPDLLLTRPPGYVLRVGPDELDAHRFEALAAEGRRLLAAGHPLPARQALDDALALWRGEALGELSSQKVAWPAVARWRELRQVAVEDRIQAALDLGEHREAVPELQDLVARSPYQERLWELLMVALYRDGRQSDALQAFTRARARLVGDLGLEPGRELRRLESAILAQAPTLEWRRGAAAAAPLLVHPVGPPPVPATRPLVGRSADLDRLDAALAEAAAGRGRTVLVAGEPGIGKTRLAEELASRASASGAAVAWGGNNEGEGATAFWPWVQALEGILEREATDVAPADAAWLAQLVPGAAPALGAPGPPPSLDWESARFRLYRAVMATLTESAARRPLVVVVDDLHWADTASIALWQFVAARLHRTRLLLVGTYQPAELAPDHPLVATLATLARMPASERLHLDGLSVPEVARFVEQGWSVAPSPDLAAALHARTEGNPFFLTELVKLLASEATLGRADAVDAAAVPAGVHDVLRRRLARLPETTNAVLRVAAVVGRTFDLDVITAATGYGDDGALEAVEAALVTGIVVEDPAVVGRFRFAHALVRQALYDDLSAVRRARLHAEVGAALARVLGEAAPRSALADHYYRAAPAVGPEKGVAYALDAATEAQAGLAYEEVEAHLGRALELLERMPAGEERDHQELRVQNRLALSLMMNGGLVSPAAGRACDRAAELAVRLGDTRELLSSMAGLSKAAIVRAEWQVVSGLGARMHALGEASGNPVGAAAGLFTLGNAEVFLGDVGQSRRHIEAAISIARPLWEQDSEAALLWVNPLMFALSVLGVSLSLADEEGPAEEAAGEAAALAEAAGQVFWLVGVYLCAAISHAFRGQVAEARAEADRCIAVGRSSGLRVVVTVAAVIRSWADARCDPGPATLARLRSDLEACDVEGVRMWRPFRLGLLADACCEAGRRDEAVDAADEGLRQCELTDERVYEAELHRLRGVALANAGSRDGADEADEALTSLRRAASVARSQGAVLFLRRAEQSLAELRASVPTA